MRQAFCVIFSTQIVSSVSRNRTSGLRVPFGVILVNNGQKLLQDVVGDICKEEINEGDAKRTYSKTVENHLACLP